MSGVSGGVGSGVSGTPVDPASPGGVLIDPSGSELVPSTALDNVWKGDGAGGWVQGPSTPGIHAPSHEGGASDPAGYALIGEPTGFPDLTSTTIAWDDPTKVFTLDPVAATFDVWVLGKKFTKTGPQTKDISGVIAEGNWYFYYDSAGVLQASQTPFDFMLHATVAVMHWDNTNLVHLMFSEERHKFFMPRQTMEFIHLAYGLVYVSGLGLTPKTLPVPGDGTLDADAEIELDDGVLLDEDIHVDPRDSGAGHFVQDLQPIAQLPVFHRETVTGVWRKKTTNNFPVQEGPGAGNDRLQWNDLDAGGAGVWGLSEVADGAFVAAFICAAPEVDEPVFVILGQETHATQQEASEANVYADLALGMMGFREQRVLYRLIFQSFDSYANAPKARLVETIDLRAAQIGSPTGTIVPNEHNALSGRGGVDAHPASAVMPSTGSFDGALSAADDTTQKALDTLDDAVPMAKTLLLEFSVSAGVPGSGTRYLDRAGVAVSSVPIRLPADATVIGMTVLVDAVDGSRAYDVQVVSDPGGADTSVAGASLALPLSTTEVSSRALSGTIAAATKWGILMTRTSGAGASTFADVRVELEVVMP